MKIPAFGFNAVGRAGESADPPRRHEGPYRGRLIAVGTRHGKQRQFAPAFRTILGAALVTPRDLDTDRLGTFTGEVVRTESAVHAARAKTRLAMDATGLPYGLASEASYGVLPGGWCGHEEILLFCDDVLGIEVLVGNRTASVPGLSHRVADAADLPAAILAGLPDQALTVRPWVPGPDGGTAPVKGITDDAALSAAVAAAAARSAEGLAVVEPDLRAHRNPSRRRVLTRLAETLAARLATACPGCDAPGFGRVGAEPGLPCRLCGTPTPLLHNEIHGCAACPHQMTRPVPGGADPAVCPSCNP